MFGRSLVVTLLIVVGSIAPPAAAAPSGGALVVGAATNFVHVLAALDGEFQRLNPEYTVRSTTAASGTLVAQIRHGAPYDVFLSADTDYPRQLIAAGLAEASTYRVFARGQLVAWTTRPGVELDGIARWADNPRINKIAIAQPATAPYGRAAQRALERAGIWPRIQDKVVLGENVAQTAQFVETGHADVGLVALSLVLTSRTAANARWVEVPPALFEGVSLDHAAILTKSGALNTAARRYLEFLTGPAAQSILRQAGYHSGAP